MTTLEKYYKDQEKKKRDKILSHLKLYEGKTVKSIAVCEQGNHKIGEYKYYHNGVKITFTDKTFIHLYDGEQTEMSVTTDIKDMEIDTGNCFWNSEED